jgi:hypothetical protein
VTAVRSIVGGMPTCAIDSSTELGAALDALEIPRKVPTIILIGGAAGMTADQSAIADRALREAVGPIAVEVGAVVVDGGTDAGVMQLAGVARAEQGNRFPLVGVVGDSLVRLGVDSDGSRIALEPNHSGVVTVPGARWGDETRWLFDLAEFVAAGRPIRTVLVNGGAITRVELAESIRRGIPVIVIRGTGRAADDLDADDVLDGSEASYDRSLISVVEAAQTEGLRSMLRDALRGEATSDAGGVPAGEGSDDGAGS